MKRFRLFITFVLLLGAPGLTALSSKICAQPIAGTEISNRHARPSPDWVKNAVIYEVYPRSFSRSESFLSIERRLPEIKKLGVTVIWLMPVHPIGRLHRKGPLGSPYSVRDYYGINREYGTLADFKKLVRAVHSAGLHIIMDLVANHTAWDNPMIREHPDWYMHDSTGKIVPPNPDWTDVAQLNYRSKGLRRYMIGMMKYWVKDIGVDGFRCDAAAMVPLDFWEEARAALDSIKPVMMLAEAEEPDMHLYAFDLTYSWDIYKTLGKIFHGRMDALAIDSVLDVEQRNFPAGSLLMRFNTNHDENAYDAPAIERYGAAGDSLTIALIATLPGVPLIYNGEEVGNPKRLSLFEQVPINWRVKNGFRKFYEEIYSVRRSNREFVDGKYETLPTNYGGDLLAYKRTFDSETGICVFNFSRTAGDSVTFDAGNLGSTEVRDLLTGKSYDIKNGKINLWLKALGFAILSPEHGK